MAIDKSIDRTKTLGGSEMGTLMGVNPYENIVDLWLSKRGLTPPKDLSGNSKVHWGNHEEPIIMNHYEFLHGVKLERDGYINGLTPDYFAANLDGYDPVNKIVVEVKTTSFMSYVKQWGEGFPVEKNDLHLLNPHEQIPATYMCQIQFYMWAKDVEAAKLILKADSHIYVEYPIKRNEGLIRAMLEASAEFWEHVKAGTKVKPRQYAEALALWTPLSQEVPLEASEDSIWSYHILKEIKSKEEALQELKERQQYTLMKQMLDEEGTCIMHDGLKIVTAFAKKDGGKQMRVNLR